MAAGANGEETEEAAAVLAPPVGTAPPRGRSCSSAPRPPYTPPPPWMSRGGAPRPCTTGRIECAARPWMRRRSSGRRAGRLSCPRGFDGPLVTVLVAGPLVAYSSRRGLQAGELLYAPVLADPPPVCPPACARASAAARPARLAVFHGRRARVTAAPCRTRIPPALKKN
jgi:hypothetical protein